MSVHLEEKDLLNAQEMEVAVNGPDGATHLILCTGLAVFGSSSHEVYSFFVGPQLSRRQFVNAIASGALSTIQMGESSLAGEHAKLDLCANLISIHANYDDVSGRVMVETEILSSLPLIKVAICYNVSILAELPKQYFP